MREPWVQLLQRLLQTLDGQPKATLRANVQRLLSWLDHRVTDFRAGYMLGHASGNAGDLLALLAAYTAEQVEVIPVPDIRAGWCQSWEGPLTYSPLA